MSTDIRHPLAIAVDIVLSGLATLCLLGVGAAIVRLLT
jgi:hypothetical protein